MTNRKAPARPVATATRQSPKDCPTRTRRPCDLSPAEQRLELLKEMERVGTTMIQTPEQAARDEAAGLPIIAVTVPAEVGRELRAKAKRIAALLAEAKEDGADVGCDDPNRVFNILEAGFFYAIERYAKDLRRNAELSRASRRRDAAARESKAKKVSGRQAAVVAELELAAKERREIDVAALAAAHGCSRDTIYRDVRSINSKPKKR